MDVRSRGYHGLKCEPRVQSHPDGLHQEEDLQGCLETSPIAGGPSSWCPIAILLCLDRKFGVFVDCCGQYFCRVCGFWVDFLRAGLSSRLA